MHSLLSKLGVFLSVKSLLSLPTIVASIAVSALMIGVQNFGILEETELNFSDRLVRLKPDEGKDPRLLVVTITEEDIQTLGKSPPVDDQTFDLLLQKLAQYQPRAIGLDIYRDLPVEPGNAELVTRLQLNDNIIAVCKVGDSSSPGLPPPPTVPEDRLGFSDIVVDSSGVVRRNLLFQTPDKTSKCPADRSFGLRLALEYLKKEGIQEQSTSQEYLQLSSTIFKPLEEDTAGYQNVDARGYQILLNYRSAANVAQQVTLTEVLAGRVNPILVRDRIVLIGATTSSNDYFYTPYSKSQQQQLRMPGVLLHAQIVSQILSAVLDKRSLIWFFPGWVEVPWILVWSLIGGSLAWRIRHPLVLVLAGGAALGGLFGICYFLFFTWQGWVPFVPPALALLGTGVSLISYKAYRLTNQPQPIAVIPANSDAVTTLPEEPHIAQYQPPKNSSNLIGRYKVLKDIGSGGFGRTFLAEDTLRPGNPHCVVKQLAPAKKDEGFVKIAKRLFEREAESLEALGRHDRIPQLLAYFEENKEFYLVQEFIKGHSLSEELIPGKRLLESQVVDMLKDVLEVLDFIHSHSVIHRDIKPANIIRRDSDRKLVLIDFGAVKLVQSQIIENDVEQLQTHKRPHTVMIGTVTYAAPEQLSGEPVFNSDIYALGIIGIQAVTGQAPNQLHISATTKSRDYAQVSDRLAAILDKMVQYHPSERYDSAVEVLRELNDNF